MRENNPDEHGNALRSGGPRILAIRHDGLHHDKATTPKNIPSV